MASDRRFVLRILGDADHAMRAFETLDKGAGKMGSQFNELGKTAARAFGAISVGAMGSAAVSAASDLAESINAVEVTFGDAAEAVLALGENSAKTVGMSAQQFNAFAVQFAGFTQQLTTSGRSAADITDELSRRIVDFSSVMNLDVAEAAQVFQSSLSGQTEPIRRFGIDLSAAAVQAYALNNGLVDNASQMTESIKVQARYGLLMEETAKTAGDFENTSDSLANRTRVLKAELGDAAATVGEALVPVLENLLSVVMPVLDAFTSLPKPVQQFVTIGTAAAFGFRTLSKTIQNFGVAAKTANIATGTLAAGLGLLLLALQEHAAEKAAIAQSSDAFLDAMRQEAEGVEGATRALIVQKFATGELGDATEALGLTANDVADAMLGDEEATQKLNDALADASVQGQRTGMAFDWLLDKVIGQTGFDQFTDAVRQTEQGMESAERTAGRLADAEDELADSTKGLGMAQQIAGMMTGDYSKQLDLTAGDVFFFTEEIDRLRALQERQVAQQSSAIQSFVNIGNALQWPITQTRQLVSDMGLLDGLSVEVQIELGLFTEAEAALQMLDLQIRALRTSMSALGQGQFMQQRLAPLFQIRNELVALIADGASEPFTGGGGGGTSPVDSAEDDFQNYVDQIVDFGNSLLTDRFAESLFEGTPESIRDVFRDIMDDVARFTEGQIDQSLRGFIGNLQGKFAQLSELARLREELQDQLDGINKVVESSSKLFTADLDLSDDAELSLTDQMANRLEAARQFMYDIGWLVRHHWPASIIQEVLNAGIAGGSKMVAAFKAMPLDEQMRFRNLFQGLETMAEQTRTLIFEGLGGHEIEGALGDTNSSMERLVSAIQNDLTDAFSTFLTGLGAEIDRLNGTGTATFTHPILGEIPVSRSASKSTGAAVNITINAGMGTDGQSLGKQIVDVLNTYAASGGAPLSAQVVSR